MKVRRLQSHAAATTERMLITTSSQHVIWEYFKPLTGHTKHALCLTCNRKLERGIELTASMKEPNLKHHLKTVHPELYVTYQHALKQNNVNGLIKSARGER